MKIILARTAGFCFGVKRAVDLAIDKASQSANGIYTVGPIIHNAQTVQMLKQRGAQVLDESKPLSQPSSIMIRAHGVPPEKEAFYHGCGHTVIDGTCPKVKTVHKVIQKFRDQGYEIVITGDKGHAEVVALLGYTEGKGHLINSVADVDTLPEMEKICLVSQTTFERNAFDKIAEKMQARFGEENVLVKKTICSATDQRQLETIKLAGEVDAMIVVGGKHSANTLRLAKLAAESGKPTQHIESEKEIDWEKISHCETIGVTAGASTPDWLIKQVVDYLKFLDRKNRRSMFGAFRRFIDIVANLNLFAALGAAIMFYVSCRLQSFSFSFSGAVTVFLYFFAIHLWNSLSGDELEQYRGLTRYEFYHAHKKKLYLIIISSVIAVSVISYLKNLFVLYFMLFSIFAGFAYHMSLVPLMLRKIIPYRRLKDIPTSRDLFVALAWAVVISLLPQITAHQFSITLPFVLCFGWIFFLAYIRSLFFDLRDIESDRIMGRETLVTIIGEKHVRTALQWIMPAVIFALLVYPAILLFTGNFFSATGIAFIAQIPVLLYLYFLSRRNRKKAISSSSLFNFLVDGQFYIAGLLAWLASLLPQSSVSLL